MNTTNQDGQTHYNGWDAFAKMQEVLGENPEFLLGNVVKYVYRYDKKGTPLQDLEKAKVYLDKKMQFLGIGTETKGTDSVPNKYTEPLRQNIFTEIWRFKSIHRNDSLVYAARFLNQLIKTIKTTNVSQT